MKTVRGRRIRAVGQAGVGSDKKTLELHDHGKGIIGMRCGVKEDILSLTIYAALRIDIATKDELAQY